MRQIDLRPAIATDLPAVLELLEKNKLPLEGVEPWFGNFLVALDKGLAVGAAGYERYDDYALLRSVVVAESMRGTGIGELLVQQVIEAAQSAGVRSVYLLTTTAEHYFPKFGFQKTAREEAPEPLKASEEFVHACPASASVMFRDLHAVQPDPVHDPVPDPE